jgi:uncharacterized SAM-binding protein YcdF (DUF218 family)
MFFYISKILGFMISPMVWVFALLIWSFITKIESKAKKLRIIALTFLYICSNSFIVDELFRWYEPAPPDFDYTKKYTGAIVLGGIGSIDMRLQKIDFRHSVDRLLQPLPLVYTNNIEKIIFTGGSGSIESPEKKEAIFVKKYLKSINFPDSSLIIEYNSKNTYENAIFTKRIIDSLNSNGNYLLVTSAYHMPRSIAVFKKAGYKNLTPFITNKLSGPRRFTFDHLLIPNSEALFSLNYLLHEWVGFFVYKLKGYA